MRPTFASLFTRNSLPESVPRTFGNHISATPRTAIRILASEDFDPGAFLGRVKHFSHYDRPREIAGLCITPLHRLPRFRPGKNTEVEIDVPRASEFNPSIIFILREAAKPLLGKTVVAWNDDGWVKLQQVDGRRYLLPVGSIATYRLAVTVRDKEHSADAPHSEIAAD